MSKNDITRWNSNFSFLMAMIGSAVGLGNIWRFPYVLYTNGEGSFMIPYIVALLLLGLCFLLLEYAIGYKFKTSILNVFYKIKDKFQILGWLICVIIFLILTYYVCIVGWDLIYFALSFFKGWGSNPNHFFSTTLLQSTNSYEGILNIVPAIFISALIVWFIIWLISHKNLNDGIGKFSKIAVPLLVVLVLIIVIYSLSLPGASIGYTEMFTPNWNVLGDLNIWLVAFGQIIFSLSLGMAIVLTYTSYLPDNSNLTKNASIVLLSNSGFEIFNAIGIFSILGFMSFKSGVPFEKIITEGAGLAFIAFPEVFNIMGISSYILGPLFFLCIFIAGLTSAIALVEPISSSLTDKFNLSRKKAVSIICILGFLVTVIFTTGIGSSILTIFDRFLNNFVLLLAIILECIVFSWFYPIDNLVEVLNKNTSFKVGNIWKYTIKYVLPLVLLVLWFNGVLDIFKYSDMLTIVVESSLSVILITVPILLYYWSKRVNEKGIK